MDRFLLISLNIDAILEGVTIAERRKKLEEVRRGNGLSDAYRGSLKRLSAQAESKSRLGLKVLMWVLNSQRPLGVGELCHALGVEIGSVDLDPKNVPTLRTLLSSCLGLVTVEASSRTFRLVHFTLKEHLVNHPTLFNNFHNPHATIAEVCLTYLNSRSVMGLSPTLSEAPSTIPFVDYASRYWGEHTRREMTENVKALALRLLDRFDEHISARQLLLRLERDENWTLDLDEEEQTKFTGLHVSAFFGVVEICAEVLKMKEWDINAGDCFGSTALSWAARGGHEAVVQMLLKRKDINPDHAEIKYGRTPLSRAAAWGREGVVRMLLERKDVNPDQADTEYGLTPLMLAAMAGHEGIVKILLERQEVNPDRADTQDGRAPLFWAAQFGHERIVKMLLERKDVDPDPIDTTYGATPLGVAAYNGHEGVVKMLLEQGTNPDRVATKHGATPLNMAAQEGHEGVVKMLLEWGGVNPDQADTSSGQTPLSRAAENGHHEVVKMLLEQQDVNPDHIDTKHGQTPLGYAAIKGYEGIVKILLERTDVNPNHRNIRGGTPLLFAAERGHEGVAKILLEREEVNPDQPETECGQTPLSRAAECGHEGVVKILLDR